jgi:V/A-type H+/Na+-transporting ATPase subunit A
MTQDSKKNIFKEGVITRVTGPLVFARGISDAALYELVRVSGEKLLGEIIEIKGDTVSIQVYEETSGVSPGEKVERTGQTMSVALGPGLLESIYDGIQRPLKEIEKESGGFMIKRGIVAKALDETKKWNFHAIKKTGEVVIPGDILGEVQETSLIKHKIMVPPGVSGKLTAINGGGLTILDTVATIQDSDKKEHNITMLQYWPIRRPRPVVKKIFPKELLVTGIRTIDSFFPIVKGGAGSIPGPFGSGKTVTQQNIAKYCDAQIIVYIGCGERGNEMTEVLDEFPHLLDPHSGEPLMKRTVLIANTSNMPVAAREASVYTGITIAEYYRDMGLSVALMADSTSRWAEAMREISGRLEEMPGEEGYPAYLASRTAEFYERAGLVTCLGSDERIGALTVIGAVSPPGGDLSEPVSQATLRVTKTFWGLDANLAYKKHFPSINWLTSYSLYAENLEEYWAANIDKEFSKTRSQALALLQEEAKLQEIVRLVGMDALSPREKASLNTAKLIREEFLFQNAFDKEDAFTSPKKQFLVLKKIFLAYDKTLSMINDGSYSPQNLENTEIIEKINNIKHGKDN